MKVAMCSGSEFFTQLFHRRPKLTARDSCLRAVLYYKRIYKGLYEMSTVLFKRRENVMFSKKNYLPYCLVVFFVVCPRLRPFWSVFGELACFWCSTAIKIKTRQHRDFRNNQECPSLEENNSAGKNYPPASIPPHIQSRDVAVPCPFTRFAIPPTDRSLAMLLSLARSASQFRIGFVQTAVDPFADRIVCRVTKISPARVASVL